MEPVDFNPARHEYRKNGVLVPSVTQVLARSGRIDYSYVQEEIRSYSMSRGQSVHWLTQLEDEGALDYRRVPRNLRGYRKAWKDWKCCSGFQPLWVERRFISHYGYGGTIDRTGTFPSGTSGFCYPMAVVDIKSAEKEGQVADWIRFQLCAYCLGVIGTPSLARTIRRIAVRLCANGSYRVKEWPLSTWDSDFAEFIRDLQKCKNAER